MTTDWVDRLGFDDRQLRQFRLLQNTCLLAKHTTMPPKSRS
jgi:hypothetical protein